MARGQTSQPIETTRADRGYGPPEAVCTLEDERITEASGLIASRRTPGCYYTHNDSDNPPLVFLIDRTGRTRLTIHLTDAKNIDWEDIALAPGEKSGTFDVCVADIGDNRGRRKELTIYRFPEPAVPAAPASQSSVSSGSASQPTEAERGKPLKSETTGATLEIKPTAYRIRYADGPCDAESFFVHPRTGDGYILTKRMDGHCGAYKLAAPWNAKETTVLPKVAEPRFPDVVPLEKYLTAADLSPDGRWLAARSYVCGWEWRLPAETPDQEFERIFNREPTRLALAAEPQGEGLCYSPDGRAILTISEKLPTVLYEMRREALQSSGPP